MIDNTVIAKMGALVTCLCEQIVTEGLPDVCACGLLPGDAVALDHTGDCSDVCGMAWVRLVEASPATGVAVGDSTVNNCAASLGWDLEIGISRCLDVLDENGDPPSVAAMAEATVLQIADMLVMRKAVACCTALGDYILGVYVPSGPEGGTVSGTWSLSLIEV